MVTTKDIIEGKLFFLIKEYGFSFEFNNTNGDHYIFKNRNGYIEFYEWAQFGESKILVKHGNVFEEINLIYEYPKEISKFNSSHKGIKYFFKDIRNDYWEMIARIIKLEISDKNSIFRLKI